MELIDIKAPEELSIVFCQDGTEVGRMWWSKEDSEFKFKGKLNESADMFMEFIRKSFDAELEEFRLKAYAAGWQDCGDKILAKVQGEEV